MAGRYYQGIIAKDRSNYKKDKKKGVLSFFKSICAPRTIPAIIITMNTHYRGTNHGIAMPLCEKIKVLQQIIVANNTNTSPN